MCVCVCVCVFFDNMNLRMYICLHILLNTVDKECFFSSFSFFHKLSLFMYDTTHVWIQCVFMSQNAKNLLLLIIFLAIIKAAKAIGNPEK